MCSNTKMPPYVEKVLRGLREEVRKMAESEGHPCKAYAAKELRKLNEILEENP